MAPVDASAIPRSAPASYGTTRPEWPVSRPRDNPGDDQRQVTLRAGQPPSQQARQAQLAGHGVHSGDVPVRQRPGDGDRLPGGHQGLTLQPGVDQVDDVPEQRGQVGHGLVLDRAGLPVGAAQVSRGVVRAQPSSPRTS